jgi:glyoxylase-like metal-dependent hydrolase (beta-lactamase superfamily II)
MSSLIKKITAPNGGVFTGGGTNTYLVGKEDITVVDPGPYIQSHLDKIIEAGNNNIKRIIVTHTHKDHSPGAKPLAEILNVPVIGSFAKFDMSIQDETFKPDQILHDKDIINTSEYTIEVIHTPGHASNHFCFLIQEEECLLTGDHIMNGSTVVIAPPDGNMTEYLESLKKLDNFNIKLLAPGHGDYLHDPKLVTDWIFNHRLTREKKVLISMQKLKETTIEDLLLDVYDDVDSHLHPIALWSLEAHLIRLEENNLVTKIENTLWRIGS